MRTTEAKARHAQGTVEIPDQRRHLKQHCSCPAVPLGTGLHTDVFRGKAGQTTHGSCGEILVCCFAAECSDTVEVLLL